MIYTLKEGAMIMTISTVVMAMATVCLAFLAYESNRLAKEIKRTNDLREAEDKEFRRQVSDLYQAIVVATIINGAKFGDQVPAIIDVFKRYYKGKPPYFNNKIGTFWAQCGLN